MNKTCFCKACGKEFPKGEIHQFDSTIRGNYPSGMRLALCTPCMLRQYRSSLLAFKGRAVVIQPLPQRPLKRVLFWRVKPFNAYQFYPLNLMRTRDYNFSQEWIDAISKYFPSEEARCKLCNARAQYNWCSPDLYYRSPFDAVNTSGDFEQEFLCSNCLADRFSKIVCREGLYFAEVQPPVETDGMCSSFEV